MYKFFFTFGMSHPMANIVFAMEASDENVAREAMTKMVGSGNWASCYFQCPTKNGLIVIGSAVTADAFLADADFR
jgi:hypothetical protein